jgi:hypothetical protein
MIFTAKTKCAQAHSEGGQRCSQRQDERDRVRVTVTIISTVVTYLVSSGVIYRLIYVNRSRVVQSAIKGGVGPTPETLVGDAQIRDEGDRTRSVRQARRQLNVPTPLTRLWDTMVVLTCGHHEPPRQAETGEVHCPHSRSQRGGWHGWQGGARAGAMTKRRSPQDHPEAPIAWRSSGKVPSQAPKREVLV